LKLLLSELDFGRGLEMRWPLLVLTALLLVGCTDPATEQAAAAQARANAQTADDAQCRSYGVQPGSPGYVQCRMNLDNARMQDLQQRRALAAEILLNRH
jgi:hypothetical protein